MPTGTLVTVADDAGKRIGAGSLRTGTTIDSSTCKMGFTIADLPANLSGYVASISHRGSTRYTLDDAENGVHLVLDGSH
jgi:hypothetical protein